MSQFIAQIDIMPLSELLDPQGKAVNNALHNLGLKPVQDVRIGKHIRLDIEAGSLQEAQQMADDACKKMLCNAVMETYTIIMEQK